MAVGLGGEQLWLSPTVANNVNPFDDQSGQGNNGTAQGGLSTVADTGAGGAYAYDLDGVDDFILLPAGVIPTTGSLTISLWVEHTNTTGSKAYVSDWDSAATKRSVLFTSLSGNHSAYFSNNGAAVVNQISGSAVTTTWTHVLLSQKAGTGELEFYKNGVLDDTGGPYPGRNNSGTPWLVGALGATGSYAWFFDGKMDDIRAYNRLLTQAEITHLATARGIQGRPFVGLGGEQLWLSPTVANNVNPFDDQSGQGNNGTAQGGVSVVSDTGSGGSYAFESYNTATDLVSIPSGVLSNSSDVSLSVWVKNKQTSAGSNVRNIVRTTNGDLFIYANQTRYRGGAGGVFVQDTLANLNTTQYYHYALNYTQAIASVELFRNGVSIGTTSGAAAITVTGTMDVLQKSFAFVDDVRAYNRALTQAEITHLATSRGVLGPPGGATHYNPFKSHAFINDFQQRLR